MPTESAASIPNLRLRLICNQEEHVAALSAICRIPPDSTNLLDRIPNPLHRDDFDSGNGLLRLVCLGHEGMDESELGRLLQPFLTALDRPNLPRQADLAEHHRFFRQGSVPERGNDRKQDSEVRPGLGDFYPPYRVDEYVLVETGD